MEKDICDICSKEIKGSGISVFQTDTNQGKSKRLCEKCYVKYEESTNNEQELIAKKFDELKNFVLAKNKQYGSSALHPVRIFSKNLSVRDGLFIRLDDKISRVIRGNFEIENMEDTLKDVVGYCILALIDIDSEKNR
jgi:hypothetical protein